MNRMMRILAIAVGTWGLLQAAAQARGLLGERFVSVGGGVVFIENENINDFDDTQVFYGASVNVPVCKYADIGLGVGRAELDGENDADISLEASANSVGLDVTAHAKPGEKMDPFATVGAAYVDTETDVHVGGAGGVSEDDSDEFYDLAVGVQFDLGNDFAIAPIAELNDIGDDETFELTLAANKWFTKNIAVEVVVARDFDDGNVTLGGSLNIGF